MAAKVAAFLQKKGSTMRSAMRPIPWEWILSEIGMQRRDHCGASEYIASVYEVLKLTR